MQSIPTDRTSKHTFWQRQVIQFQRSDATTAAQFCRDQGLPYQSFKVWQKKLETQPSVSEVQTKSFVRIQAAPTKLGSITCRLPNGLELSWDISTPASTISAVIQEVSQL